MNDGLYNKDFSHMTQPSIGVEKVYVDSGDKKTVTLELDVKNIDRRTDIKENPYSNLIHLSDAFDSWRVFPRLFIILYMYMAYTTTEWFISLPDPNPEQSAFMSIVIGAGAVWFGIYSNAKKITIDSSYKR